MMSDEVLLGCCVGLADSDDCRMVMPVCALCGHREAYVCRWRGREVFGTANAIGGQGWSYWLPDGFLCPTCTRQRSKSLTGWEA